MSAPVPKRPREGFPDAAAAALLQSTGIDPTCSPDAIVESKRLRVASPSLPPAPLGVGTRRESPRDDLLELLYESLMEVGLRDTAAALQVECGRVIARTPGAALREMIAAGDWRGASLALEALPFASPAGARRAALAIAREWVLEALACGNAGTALAVLRSGVFDSAAGDALGETEAWSDFEDDEADE